MPTFFLLSSFTFLFEDFYSSVKEYKKIRTPVFVAVQDSCTYAGTKLCLNDHYLCETFCLGWAIHHCNTWIPQCGPGNKTADGALYASHTPCPSRLQHPWTFLLNNNREKEEGPPPPPPPTKQMPFDGVHFPHTLDLRPISTVHVRCRGRDTERPPGEGAVGRGRPLNISKTFLLSFTSVCTKIYCIDSTFILLRSEIGYIPFRRSSS